MVVEIPPLQEGQPIYWPNVTEDRIVHVFDRRTEYLKSHPAYGRGYMGVRSSGNVDVFWHRWKKLPNGRIVSALAHHGGPEGFDDIETPIRQCRRIITGYIGIEETLEEDGVEEPAANFKDFSELLGATADTVYIPGQQQFILDIKSQIDKAIRQVTVNPRSLRMGGSINILQDQSTKLERSTQPMKRALNEQLRQAITSSDRFSQFEALLKGNQGVLEILADMDRKVVATMHRHNELDAHRSVSESVAVTWALAVLKQKANLDAMKDVALVAQRVKEAEDQAVSQLITNPFRKKALRIQRFHTISRKAIELSNWKQDIREAQRGRYTDRYPVQA